MDKVVHKLNKEELVALCAVCSASHVTKSNTIQFVMRVIQKGILASLKSKLAVDRKYYKLFLSVPQAFVLNSIICNQQHSANMWQNHLMARIFSANDNFLETNKELEEYCTQQG